MQRFSTLVTSFLMPADAMQAQTALHDLIATPGEIWCIFYEASSESFFSALLTAKLAGSKIHVLADLSLAKRTGESGRLKLLKNAGIDVAVGTSTLGAWAICHAKTIICVPFDSKQRAKCFEGSTNFSDSSWAEINTAMSFDSDEYAAQVIDAASTAMKYGRSNYPDNQP